MSAISLLEQELKEAWHRHAQAHNCAVCGCKGSLRYIEGHHIVYRQHIEKVVKQWEGDEALRAVWDLRNCLPLCRLCHMRHHNARRKVTQLEIRKRARRAWQFSAEVKLGWFIDRYYDRGEGDGARVAGPGDAEAQAVSGLAH